MNELEENVQTMDDADVLRWANKFPPLPHIAGPWREASCQPPDLHRSMDRTSFA